MAALSLEVLQARMDGALSNVGSGKCLCLLRMGWKEVVFKVPPKPGLSMFLYFCE